MKPLEPHEAELYFPGNRASAGRGNGGVFPQSQERDAGIRLLEGADLARLLPPLDPDCHKGDRGALGVYAGALGAIGAAVLCCRAGSAAGSGSVTLFIRDELVGIAAGMLVAQMVRPVSDPGGRRLDAVVAGPGWGVDALSRRLLAGLWDADLPLVLDADALTLLAERPVARRGRPLVITPHPGEFVAVAASALGIDADDGPSRDGLRRRALFDTAAIVRDVAARLDAVVVLKNSVTWIGETGGALAVWDGRNPALATAGSGDVLAGLIGGLVARGIDPFLAAQAGVIMHGLAARAVPGFFEAQDLIAPASRLAYQRGADGDA